MFHDKEVSERVREQGLAQLECDIPAGMSLAEWRERQAGQRAPERGWRASYEQHGADRLKQPPLAQAPREAGTEQGAGHGRRRRRCRAGPSRPPSGVWPITPAAPTHTPTARFVPTARAGSSPT